MILSILNVIYLIHFKPLKSLHQILRVATLEIG